MTRPFDLWGQSGRHEYEVVGGRDQLIQIRRLLMEQLGPEWPDRSTELVTVAQLDPERNRPARVLIDGHVLGQLRAGDAMAYSLVLNGLVERRMLPRVSALVFGNYVDRPGRPELVGSVRLDLAAPHLVAPANAAPKELHVLLPSGPAVAVTSVGTLPERLIRLIGSAGEVWVYVTLEEETDEGGCGVVEVRIDHKTYGHVPAPGSDEILPAVRALAPQGLKAAGRGLLRRDGAASSLSLHVARAGDLPEGQPRSVPTQREIDGIFRVVGEETISKPGRHRRDP